MKLPDMLQTLTALRAVIERAIREARAVAANPATSPAAASEMVALANELQQVLDSGRVIGITTLALDELKELVLTGKSVVSHQAADLF